MKNWINKRNIYLLVLFVICLLGIVIVPTYAKFGSNYITDEDVVGMSLAFDLKISNIEEYEEINLFAGEVKRFNVEVTNNTIDMIYYGIWYKMVNPSEIGDDIVVAKLEESSVNTSGSIDSGNSTTVSLVIINNSSSNVQINIGVASSVSSASDIEYLGGKTLITDTIDNTAPKCTLVSSGDFKVKSQTVSISNLTETGSGVAKYYWGTSSTGTPEATVEPLLVADKAGTWYLRIEDNSGNIGQCDITFHDYTVYNMLLKEDGIAGDYNTSNYAQASFDTYMIPNGTVMTLESIYMIPSDDMDSLVLFEGYSEGEPSDESIVLSTLAPTILKDSVYTMWFDLALED